MSAAVTKNQIELVLADRFGNTFERHDKRPAETLPTGIVEIDRLLHGFARGAITEIHGSVSSGRTSVLLSALAAASLQAEICALIDCSDTFDLSSAAKADVDFNLLLWVRCRQNLERAFKAVDLILHGGGFSLVVLNLSDVPAKAVRRIISSWWFRFRRAIVDTPTALIILTPIAAVRSCAALVLELNNESVVWPNTLSLVSENRNGSFTEKRPRPGHLSLVPASTSESQCYSPHSYSHFLQATQIHVNRERPVQWQPGVMTFCARR